VFPNPAACRSLCRDGLGGKVDEDTPLAELGPPSRSAAPVDGLPRGAQCRSTHEQRRIARALLLAEPPSIQSGEITDKGYVNQRAVLERRAARVEQLYGGAPSPELIIL